MSEPPYEEIKKYITDNCPYNGWCFLEMDKKIEEKCPYQMMDGIPCRYMPDLLEEFKEIYKNEGI